MQGRQILQLPCIHTCIACTAVGDCFLELRQTHTITLLVNAGAAWQIDQQVHGWWYSRSGILCTRGRHHCGLATTRPQCQGEPNLPLSVAVLTALCQPVQSDTGDVSISNAVRVLLVEAMPDD